MVLQLVFLLVPDQNELEAAPVAVGGLIGLEIQNIVSVKAARSHYFCCQLISKSFYRLVDFNIYFGLLFNVTCQNLHTCVILMYADRMF